MAGHGNLIIKIFYEKNYSLFFNHFIACRAGWPVGRRKER
jgi:hypothetical protein